MAAALRLAGALRLAVVFFFVAFFAGAFFLLVAFLAAVLRLAGALRLTLLIAVFFAFRPVLFFESQSPASSLLFS